MELEIFWTESSEKELEKIFLFYLDTVNLRTANKITEGIFKETLKLRTQPEIGQIEDFLINRKEHFRYLLYKNYKIIYWINKEQNWIEISDVFDTRQNPLKITRI